MLKRICSTLKKKYWEQVFAHSCKIFCIGRNKTGTTSIAKLFLDLGYHVAPQRPGDLLLKNWANNEFGEIIKFSRYGGQVFQDIPFSLPETYKHLDKAFPGSKFILTIRDSPEIWYDSVIRSQSKLFGHGKIPQDLMTATYTYPGYMWEVNQLIYHTPENDPYNKEILIGYYLKHNADVMDYFGNKSAQLLVLNLKEADAGKKIADFIGSKRIIHEVPWENKT